MPTINFSGLASGLDTNALINALLEVERLPIQRLEQRQQLFSSQKAAFDELRSKLVAFESSLRDLGSQRTFRGRTGESSDESVARVSAGTSAETGLFDVDVTRLAEASKVKSDGFASSSEAQGLSGQITLKAGDNEQITIDVQAANLNDNLAAIRDAVNNADAGVQASIIFDGTDYRLTVRSEESGLANALVVTDGTALNLDAGGNVVSTAQDAALTIDGIDVTSSDNSVTDAIEGVTLELIGAGTTSIEIARDEDAVVQASEDLLKQYNDLNDFFREQDNPDSPGALGGDSTLRRVQSRVQRLFTRGLEGIAPGGIRSLSSIGVSFDGRTGEASLDTEELRGLLAQQFDEIGDLFLSKFGTTDPRIEYVGSTSATKDGAYDVRITSAAEQATLVGSTSIDKLNLNETLSITLNGNTTNILLLKNQELPEIITTINDALDTAGIAVTASDDGGKLRLDSDEFGSDQALSVISDRNDTGNGKSTGFDDQLVTDLGGDVEGTIDGVTATVDGNLLTIDDGDAAGVSVRANVSAADVIATGGDFGQVEISSGLIGTLLREISGLTKFGASPIDAARDGLDDDIKRIGEDITRIERRLVGREAYLIRTFTAAERAISLLQAQQAQLGSVT